MGKQLGEVRREEMSQISFRGDKELVSAVEECSRDAGKTKQAWLETCVRGAVQVQRNVRAIDELRYQSRVEGETTADREGWQV